MCMADGCGVCIFDQCKLLWDVVWVELCDVVIVVQVICEMWMCGVLLLVMIGVYGFVMVLVEDVLDVSFEVNYVMFNVMWLMVVNLCWVFDEIVNVVCLFLFE